MKTFSLIARAAGRKSLLLLVVSNMVLAACEAMPGVQQPTDSETGHGGGDY